MDRSLLSGDSSPQGIGAGHSEARAPKGVPLAVPTRRSATGSPLPPKYEAEKLGRGCAATHFARAATPVQSCDSGKSAVTVVP